MRVEFVVVLNDFCHAQGGASRVAIDEAVALKASGLKVCFLGAVGPVCETLRDAGVTTVCLDQPGLADAIRHPGAALRAVWNASAYRAAAALLERLDRSRTIVHLHGYTKALSTAPAAAARRAGFPVVCTLHDFFAACPNGAFFNYPRQTPCALRALSAECLFTACDKRNRAQKAYRVARGVAQSWIGRFPSGVSDYIALSRRSAELLRPYLPRDADFWPLDNIIGVTRAPPVDAASNTTLMVVGRLDPEKGVLLAASAAARAKLPIRFVGDGPLQSQIEATGASVTGWLAADAVVRELAAARCLIFPSLWYETFGLVVTEAAARGVPAIVSDISAPADRVTSGGGGWLFRAGDPASLIERIELTRDDAAIRQAGEAAYRHYWANPADPRSHTEALLSIYAGILTRARAVSDDSTSAIAGCGKPRQATHSTPPASRLARDADRGRA